MDLPVAAGGVVARSSRTARWAAAVGWEGCPRFRATSTVIYKIQLEALAERVALEARAAPEEEVGPAAVALPLLVLLTLL